MAVQALYRRWRPQSFDEVIGQSHITQTLQNAVVNGRLVHAYLFTGPRGTGKTSVARILAKAVNCTGEGAKPCNGCSTCRAISDGRSLDLIEIDAASNTGVDDVRDLREKIGFAPNEATYKVYIIDESHMLSTAAFNALLKTLEEPPPHALFILATTEPHKIPDTIASRCQRHDFRRVPLDALGGKLAHICASEGISAEPAALELVARSATGSIRDGESLLDQLMAAGGTITVADVRAVLGTPTDDAVAGLVDAILDRDSAAGLRLINSAVDRGTDPRQLRGRMLDYLRGLLLIQTGVEADLLRVDDETLARMRGQAARLATSALAAAIHRFNDARPSPDRTQPALTLELALVETVLAAGAPVEPAPGAPPTLGQQAKETVGAGAGAAPVAGATTEPRTGTAAGPAKGSTAGPVAASTTAARTAAAAGQVAGAPTEPRTGAAAGRVAATAPEATTAAAAGQVAGAAPKATPGRGGEAGASRSAALGRLESQWEAFTASVAERDKNTAALLKDCRPVAVDDESVTLGFFYDFHCQRVSEPARQALVRQALEGILGGPLKLRCTLVAPSATDKATRPRSKTDQAKADPLVRHAVEELGAEIAGVQPHTDDR